MARLNLIIPDDLDRQLELLCVNKSELARRGLYLAIAELKHNLGVTLKAANDAPPAPPTTTATPPPAPTLDELIDRAQLAGDGPLTDVLDFTQVCAYLEVDEATAISDMMAPPIESNLRSWVTKDQVFELCTLSPHPAKADSLKQWA